MSPSVPTRLVQLTHPDEGRRAALVYNNELHLLATYRSVYDFALASVETGWKLRDLLSSDLSGIVLDYDEVYESQTLWRFLSAFDHPREPGCCVVSGLVGEGSGPGWQYQGSGDCLGGHDQAIALSCSPAPVGLPEIAAAYVIGEGGVPRRVGVAQGLRSPRRNLLGPELIVEADFRRIEGKAHLFRAGRDVWSREFSAEVPLTLALAAVEPDHFRRADHRRSGDTHVHYFGEKLFGGSEYPSAEDGDEIEMELKGFGRKLRSRILVKEPAALPFAVLPL